MESDTALKRASDIRVLYSVSLKYLHGTVVHLYWEIYFGLTLRVLYYLEHILVDMSYIHCLFHYFNDILVWIVTTGLPLPLGTTSFIYLFDVKS